MEIKKKSQAVISVFLIIVLLPIWGLAVVLIDGARVQSAKMMVQEAGDLAAMSTLAQYNVPLKEDYGLFALANEENANKVFESYLKSSLKASVGGNDEYSDKMYEAVKGAIFSEEDGITSFTDLFHFNVGTPTVTPLFSLDQKEVMQNQIVEYTKYRGAYFLADRFSLLANTKALKTQMDDTKKSSELMEKKLEIDEAGAKDVEDKIQKLNERIQAFYSAEDAASARLETYGMLVQQTIKDIEKTYDAFVLRPNDENTYPPDDSIVKDYDLSDMSKEAAEVGKSAGKAFKSFKDINGDTDEIGKIITNINTQIANLRNLRDGEVEQSDASCAEEMKKDIEDTISKYERYKIQLEKIRSYFEGENYRIDYKNLKIANSVAVKVHDALKKSIKDDQLNSPSALKGEDNEDLEEQMSYLQYYGMREKNDEYKVSGDYILTMQNDAVLDNYLGESNQKASKGLWYYNISCKNIKDRIPLFKAENSDEDDKTKDTEAAAKEANKKNESGTKKIPDDEYAILPSKGAEEIDAYSSTYVTDPDQMTNNTHGIFDSMDIFSNMAEATRDEALTLIYLMGMFKTRMSDAEKFCVAQSPATFENYHVKWRYEHEDGEHDLREIAKSGLDTVLDYEVEYVFGGKQSDALNSGIIYAWIYGTRVANNIVAIYSNSSYRSLCLALGTAASAATGFIVSPTIFQWVFITAWALAETTLELSYLIDKGYRIPLIKTSKNVLISEFGAAGMESRLQQTCGMKGSINVCYEDYLLIMLLFVPSNTRVRRMGDLVQLNMRKRHDKDFMLNKASTYIEAKTDIGIDYLFQPVGQFSSFYEGYGKGIQLKNTIVQGY